MKNLSKNGVMEYEMKKAFNKALTHGNRDGWFPYFNKTDFCEIKVCFEGKIVSGPITGSGLRDSIEDCRTYTFGELQEYI